MRKGMALLLISCLVLAGCKSSSKDTSTDEIVLESNQSLKYGQVSKINGNEITISWATEVSSSDMGSMRGNRPSATGDANSQSSSGQNSSDQNFNKGSDNSTQQNNNQQGGGGAPSSDSQGGNMGGGTPPDMSGNKDGGSQQNSDSTNSNSGSSSKDSSGNQTSSGRGNKTNSQSGKQNKTMYRLTGEEDTITIPVGTKVTTMLGTTTTFSRIAANDTLKLLMQKNDAGEDVVVGIWIVA